MKNLWQTAEAYFAPKKIPLANVARSNIEIDFNVEYIVVKKTINQIYRTHLEVAKNRVISCKEEYIYLCTGLLRAIWEPSPFGLVSPQLSAYDYIAYIEMINSTSYLMNSERR